MAQDGIEQDLSPEIARESLGKIRRVPDYPTIASEVEETWHEIGRNMPVLRQYISEIALHYGGQDAHKRGEISAGLISLYIVLRDSAVVARFLDDLDGLDAPPRPTELFDQDAA